MADLLPAAQFIGTTTQEAYDRAIAAVEKLFRRGIPFTLEAEPEINKFRVLVRPELQNDARDAIGIEQQMVTRKLRISVDSEVMLNMTNNTIKPGETVLIGSSPSTLKMPSARPLPIGGDSKISSSHLAVQWDGVEKIQVQLVDDKNTASVGGVAILPGEWVEVEPGAKVKLGVTTLRFLPV